MRRLVLALLTVFTAANGVLPDAVTASAVEAADDRPSHAESASFDCASSAVDEVADDARTKRGVPRIDDALPLPGSIRIPDDEAATQVADGRAVGRFCDTAHEVLRI